jgi:hypothetical protein
MADALSDYAPLAELTLLSVNGEWAICFSVQ